jgi:hypothetical protein
LNISNNYFIGNIPLSLINKVHKVILIYNNGILDLNNYILDTGIYCNSNITYSNDNYDIYIKTLNGIDIKYINASFPLTNDIQQGYQIVNTISSNSITIKLSQNATKTTTSSDYSGNSNIKLGIISSTITGFPDPEYYQYNLKKTYYKVKKIKLVSTEIPNTQLLIKTNINDKLYWQILEDGDNIYNVKIPSGNYDAPSLTNAITSVINSTARIFSNILNKDLYYQKCIANVSIKPRYQKRGIFTKILDALMSLNSPENIYVENIFNPVIIPLLKRKGFNQIQNSSELICYFKPKTKL